MLSLEKLEASFPQLKWSSWRTGLWSVGILFHLSKTYNKIRTSSRTCARIPECPNFPRPVSPSILLTFCTRGFFVVWSCPIHYRFGSIPGLCSRDASSTPSLSCHNPKWLQTLPNFPGGTKVENLCPRSYRWQIPYLRFSFFLPFHPEIVSLPISSHQEAGRNIMQVVLCLCFFLF